MITISIIYVEYVLYRCMYTCRIYIWISQFDDPSSHSKRLTLGERKWGTSRRRSSEERKRGKWGRTEWGRFPGECPGSLEIFVGFLRFTSARSIWDLTWLHQGGCHGCHGCSLHWDVLKSKKNTEENEGLQNQSCECNATQIWESLQCHHWLLTFSRFNLKKPFLPWSVGDSRTVVI